MIFNLKTKIDKLFVILQNETFQKKLKKINLILAFISIIFLANLVKGFEGSFNLSNLTFIELLLCLFYYLSNALLWISFMSNNYSLSINDYFFNWAYSKLGKYIPGGLMLFSVRLNQKIEKNKTSKNIFYGVLEEHFLLPVVAIISISFTFVLNNFFENYFIFFGSTILAFFLFKKIYNKFSPKYTSLINLNFLFIIHLNLNFLFLLSVSHNLKIENSFQFALFYFLAASIAIIFVGIPAGLGVREIIFYFVSSGLSMDSFVFNMIIRVRIILLIFDIVFGLIGIIGTFLKSRNNLCK